MVHPCCCCANDECLKTGVKIIAWLHMIGSVLFLILLAVSVEDLLKAFEGDKMGVMVLLWVVLGLLLLLCVFLFVIAYRLLQGAREENVGKCQSWRTVAILAVCIEILSFILLDVIFVSDDSLSDKVKTRYRLFKTVFRVSLEMYFIWVVSAFITQIRQKEETAIANNLQASFHSV